MTSNLKINSKPSANAAKRIRRDPAEARELILKTAESLMLKEGYAAVTVRRIAKGAGVSSTLLHYYYPKADDLLVALYRRASARDMESLKAALNTDDPLPSLWAYQTNSSRTALAAEFLALANHRKAIKAEIARFAERVRRLQAKKIAQVLEALSDSPPPFSPTCMAMLMTSVSRNLILESGVGISSGHKEARKYIEQKLAKLTS